MKLQIKYDANKHQQIFHDDDVTKFLHLSGGFGCISEDTLIETKSGLKAIADIQQFDYYKSWNGKEFIWALGTCGYPKGKANLYRVVHEHGEFLASEHHQIFCADYKYRPLVELCAGDYLNSSFLNQHHSIEVFDSSEFSLNEAHLMKTNVNYQDDYSAYCHLYDQQLLKVLNNVQFSFPLQNDVLKYAPSHVLYDNVHTDGHMEQKLKHIHPYQYYDQIYIDDFAFHKMPLVLNEEDYNEQIVLEHILQNSQQFQQFHDSNASHRKAFLLDRYHISYAYPLPKTVILAIEKVKTDWYWDLHVFGTNNYVSNNTIHHNSGKTHALIMKTFKLHWQNRPYAGGLISPTFSDYKRDLLPLMEEILEKNRIKYNYHKTDHWFELPWSRGKINVVTAENKLRGPNWAYAAINEVTLIPIERYREVIGRVRLKDAKNPQIVSCGTPEGIASQYYEMFIEKPIANSRIIYGDSRDNIQNLSPDYISSLEASYDSIMLDAYVKGLFINMTGSRFYYAYDPAKNDDPKIKEDPYDIVHVSMDFNVDPMVATMWHYDGLRIYAFDEIILSDADTNKMANALLARGFTPDRCVIYPDPAGQARSTKGQPDVQILRNKGFHQIKIKTVAPSMRHRQLNVNNLLEKSAIKLNPNKCPTLKKDLMAIEQDKVTLSKMKNNPKLTHSSDGLDYMTDILFPFSGVRSKPSIIQYR